MGSLEISYRFELSRTTHSAVFSDNGFGVVRDCRQFIGETYVRISDSPGGSALILHRNLNTPNRARDGIGKSCDHMSTHRANGRSCLHQSGVGDRFGGSNGLLHVAHLTRREVAQTSRSDNQPDGREKQRRSPSYKPSIGRFFFITIRGFRGKLLCGLRSRYHFYEKRSIRGAFCLSCALLLGLIDAVWFLSFDLSW